MIQSQHESVMHMHYVNNTMRELNMNALQKNTKIVQL